MNRHAVWEARPEPAGRLPSPIETARLLLRPLVDDDSAALAAMNADPLVMRYLGGPQTREVSDATIARARAHWEAHGFGRLAIEERSSGENLGWVTLEVVDLPGFTDDVEIGWRLARSHWGRGIATEAARAVLDRAFESLSLVRILAIADPRNAGSLGVMRKLGMRHLADGVDDGEPVTIHVVVAAER